MSLLWARTCGKSLDSEACTHRVVRSQRWAWRWTPPHPAVRKRRLTLPRLASRAEAEEDPRTTGQSLAGRPSKEEASAPGGCGALRVREVREGVRLEGFAPACGAAPCVWEGVCARVHGSQQDLKPAPCVSPVLPTLGPDGASRLRSTAQRILFSALTDFLIRRKRVRYLERSFLLTLTTQKLLLVLCVAV